MEENGGKAELPISNDLKMLRNQVIAHFSY
jgi:hypothetical protein